MATDDPRTEDTAGTSTSFLGTGWRFPPEFEDGGARMTSGEEDIRSSLKVLFETAAGERLFLPRYGLNPRELLFEPMTTTLRTAYAERIKVALLLHEPRIRPLVVRVDSPDPQDGTLRIALEYEVRATNSRYNLVFPFYRDDANEARDLVGLVGAGR